MDALSGTRVLITGGGGFIGSHLTRRLCDLGAEVHVLTKSVSSVFPARLIDVRDSIAVHEGNLTDRRAMDALVERCRPEIVFHLAAYTHVGKSWYRVDECIQSNVQGTVNLLQALDGSGYRRFVNVGTSEIYGDVDVPFSESARPQPVSPYAVSKHAAEEYCRMFHEGHDWPIVRIRPFNAYGPWQSPDRVIPEIVTRGLRGERLAMTQGRQTREFNFAPDLAEGLVLAGTTEGIDGALINLGCGEEISMRDLATTVLELLGNPIEAEFGALADRPTEIWRMYCDNTRARELLGWAPGHTLREGLAETIDWYRAQHERGDRTFLA